MMMQTKKPAANPLMEIAERIREMREIVGYSEAEMAEKTEVSVEQYHSYEQGTVDFPFTFMHKCALAFGVELTDLLEGQSAKLSSYTVTRRGMRPGDGQRGRHHHSEYGGNVPAEAGDAVLGHLSVFQGAAEPADPHHDACRTGI